MTISVVIVNWNSGPLLQSCVSSLLRHAPDCQLVVVDNASLDSSAAYLDALKAPVALIRNRINAGFAAGCNTGWKNCDGNHILFLNPDAETLAGSVQSLARVLAEAPDIWAAGGQLLSNAWQPQDEYAARAFPTLASVRADMFFLDEIWPENPWTKRYRVPPKRGQFPHVVDQPPAACLMVRRSALESLNGFDERFHPAWFEDVDLCKRIRDGGGRILLVPTARFLHQGGSSLKSLGKEMFLEYFHKNQVRYFAKHHGAETARSIRRVIVTGMCLRACVSLLHPLLDQSTRVDSARVFWNVARRIAASGDIT